jgi:hypothetical protein
VQILHPEISQQKNWLLCPDNALSHISFSPGNFLPQTKGLLSPTHPTRLTWPPWTFVFPAILTIEMIEAESLTVLNVLTEQDIQDTSKKKKQKCLGMVYTCGRGLHWSDGGQCAQS